MLNSNLQVMMRLLSPVLVLHVCVSLLLSVTSCGTSAEKQTERPNLVLILADDLGYGDLGSYGQERILTPELDKMAAEGLRFTNHYAGSTVCAPSRCVLLTGLHSGHARIRGNTPSLLLPEDFTVAELLKSAGYRTGIIGKWGVGHPPAPGDPESNGFDHSFGYLNMWHAHNYYPEYLFRNGEKVVLKNRVAEPGAHGSGVAVEKSEYAHDLFVDEALEFIEVNLDQPFFLYLALNIPHANNEAGDEGMEVPDWGEYRDLDWPDPQKGHAAMITRMDRDVGRLLVRLDQLGLTEKTLVLFSSDNGPHREGGNDPDFNDSNGPLRGIKRDLYEGGIRVPLIARWPGTVQPGGVTDHLSAFWDLLPTVADLVGQSLSHSVDGISYLPTLLGDDSEQQEHAFLYWEFYERGGKQAVRMGDWKAVRLNVLSEPNGPAELYDLSSDPGEKYNVALQHPEIVEQMSQIMSREHQETEQWTWVASAKDN